VVCIDGLGALRNDLDAADERALIDQLHVIVTEGQTVGVSVVATAAGSTGVATALVTAMTRRWVFRLADSLDAAYFGLTAATALISGSGTGAEIGAGRLIDVSCGLEAQIVATAEQRLADLAHRPGRALAECRRRIEVLAPAVPLAGLPQSSRVDGDLALTCARSFTTLDPVTLVVPAGEHVLVVGPARSGRTTALATLVERWHQVSPDGVIVSVATRRDSLRVGQVTASVGEALGVVDAVLAGDRPLAHALGGGSVLVVIDNAEAVDDSDGRLTAMAAARDPRCTILAAARPDALRAAYGHWTATVRRSRLGFVMAAGQDIDGDLFGVVLPRRVPIAARPGLAWCVSSAGIELCQVASE